MFEIAFILILFSNIFLMWKGYHLESIIFLTGTSFIIYPIIRPFSSPCSPPVSPSIPLGAAEPTTNKHSDFCLEVLSSIESASADCITPGESNGTCFAGAADWLSLSMSLRAVLDGSVPAAMRLARHTHNAP